MMKIKLFIRSNYKLIFLCIILSILSHSFFLENQIINSQYMMSPYDQFSQMIIFKDLLYDEFSQGNFFYSFYLNGGSNILSRLSYYYSTSIVFYVTALFTYTLEVFNVIQTPSMVYWASITVYISILRSMVILFVTTKYINIFTKNEKYALLGATFYAFSTIYFRHVALWEFFGDAMIWLPILLYGVERIVRNKDGKLFTVGIALTLFNNGYFAFANLLFTAIYIVLRFIIKFSSSESNFQIQAKNYLIYGLLGFGLGLPGFLPFVKGFLNTSRLSPEFSIPMIGLTEFNLGELLLNDHIQILPILFVLMITYLLNYKSKRFRFFSILSFILIILRYSPFIASLFNGFSYPQYRWHYMTFLMVGILIALGVKNVVSNLKSNLKPSALFLTLSALVTIGLYYLADNQLAEHYYDINIIYIIIVVIYLLFVLSRRSKKIINFIVLPLLFLSSLYTVFTSNKQLFDSYNMESMNYQRIYSTFDDSNNPYEKALDVIEGDSERFYRVDFTDMHNLGSQKDFSTFNVYNSFQNNYQQYFFRYFQIINNRENNGTIDGLAGRQILNSLFQSDYVIVDETSKYIVPTGYEAINEVDALTIYKNTIPLAFIHPVHDLYSAEEVNYNDFKDELLINGAIVQESLSNKSLNNALHPNDLKYTIKQIDTEVENNILLKSQDYFSIKIDLDEQDQHYDDVVIDYTLKPLDDSETGRYTYSINGHSIQLKSTGDPYSSQLFRHQAHIPYNDQVTFKLAPGTDYIFNIHSIYGVSHEALKERSEHDRQLEYRLNMNKGKINIQFNNEENFPFMVLPLFYENGWNLEINGEQSEVENVNNGMIGFEIPSGEMDIELEYRQPFLVETILIALVSLFLLTYIEMKLK